MMEVGYYKEQWILGSPTLFMIAVWCSGVLYFYKVLYDYRIQFRLSHPELGADPRASEYAAVGGEPFNPLSGHSNVNSNRHL